MSSKAAKRRRQRKKAFQAAGVGDSTLKALRGAKIRPASEVSLPPMPDRWDTGAKGPANRQNLVSEPVTWQNDKGEPVNPNNVKRMRRVDMLEIYEKRDVIDKRQRTAGMVLRDAWSKTEMASGNDYSKPKVDSSPKPDQAIDIRIDRMSHYVGISRLIPPEDAAILHAVACEGRAIAHLPEYRAHNLQKGKVHLAEALGRLADRLEGRRT